MSIFYSLLAITVLILIPIVGVGGLGWRYLFGVIIPYAAFGLFIIGIIYRILLWAKVPVPFKITTTCGQQKSLPWIKNSKLEAPPNSFWTAMRMSSEVLFFRSLFRNSKAQLKPGPKLVYGSGILLWLGAICFHYSFLVILIRHFRFFIGPTSKFIEIVSGLDSFFQIGLPILYITDLVILIALTYLLLRRFLSPQLKYISLAADYFPLFLLLCIALSGTTMRYFTRIDIVAVKELGMGLAGFHPVIPDNLSLMFFIHIFLVSSLIAYFPFSKLMHMGGIFLSPTRNMANDNRKRRHINPWNPKVEVHTYEEYEDEFREVMKNAGLPLEKEE